LNTSYNTKVGGTNHWKCKKMPVIPVDRVVDMKKVYWKKWRAE
jgi:hypothetical protein